MESSILTDDSSLVKGCRKGQKQYQQALYARFSAKMYGVCLRYAKDSATAEDLLQEGFIKVYTHIKSFRGDGSLEGWIRRIVVNTAIENYRRNMKMHIVSDFEERNNEPSFDNVLDSLKAEDILKLIQALPDGFRTVFNLYVIEDYTHKEIASKLGINEGTSKSQLARARKILRRKVNQYYGFYKEEHVESIT